MPEGTLLRELQRRVEPHLEGESSCPVLGGQGSQEAWLLPDPSGSALVLPSSRLRLASQPNITDTQASKPLTLSTRPSSFPQAI